MRLLRLFAIAWLTLMILAERRSPNLDDLTRRNRETIGSLFENPVPDDLFKYGAVRTTTSSFIDSGRAALESGNPNTKKASLITMKGPEILQDSDVMNDAFSEPHVRVKRISDSMNSRKVSNPSRRNLSPPHIDQRRLVRKMFKRFAMELSNPADENEAEYDDEVDVPAAFLDDEVNKKRNKLEDVYPEVSEAPKRRDSRLALSNPPVGSIDMDRRKRDREEEAEEMDCADDEQSEDYYYDEEQPEKLNEEEQKIRDASENSLIAQISDAENENVESSKSNQQDVKISKNDQNFNVKKEDYLRFPSKAARLEALHEKSSNSLSHTKPGKSPVKKEKTKPDKKPIENKHKDKKKQPKKPEKPKSQKKLTKEKIKPKPKTAPNKQSKINAHSKPSKINNPAKLSSSYVESDRLSHKPKVNSSSEKKIRKDVKTKLHDKNAKGIVKETTKSNKGIVAKVSDSKKEASKRKETSMGEVKDLLGKLIVKVEDLHALLSEMKIAREDQQLSDIREK